MPAGGGRAGVVVVHVVAGTGEVVLGVVPGCAGISEMAVGENVHVLEGSSGSLQYGVSEGSVGSSRSTLVRAAGALLGRVGLGICAGACSWAVAAVSLRLGGVGAGVAYVRA